MFPVDSLILVTGILLLMGIASSKLSARIGVPVLVLFLLVGMLAGSEGIGGLDFDNFALAQGIGTIALSFILFDGGLSTPLSAVKSVWKPAFALATIGVLLTAAVTALAATYVLKVSWLEGLLLASIVGSTDAAAVFAVLRSGGVALPRRLSSLIEIESASNDPMAIFLTVGCIQVLTNQVPLGPGLIGLFVSQMVIGAVLGLVGGFAAVRVVNRINLDAAGLYPVMISGFSLLIFGVTAWLGGSGFLAVYLAGIVIGNSRLVFKRGILLFHNAGAWLSQIVMFVVLGLLSFPSRLLSVTWQGLLISAVLIVFARPIAVGITLLPFRFNFREKLFISWVGLKGAVPITLATFPLLLGVKNAGLLFDVVFFVVVVSAIIQGWSLPLAARWLGLEVEPEPAPPITLELSSLRHVDGDIVDYSVGPQSRAAGRLVKDLALPDGVVIAIIARGEKLIPPQGSTRVEEGDHVIVVLRPATRPLVNRIFGSAGGQREELPALMEFPLRATTTVGELEEMYDIEMKCPPEITLADAIRTRLGSEVPFSGRVVRFGRIALRVREFTATGHIAKVSMLILADAEEESDEREPAAEDASTSIASAQEGRVE